MNDENVLPWQVHTVFSQKVKSQVEVFTEDSQRSPSPAAALNTCLTGQNLNSAAATQKPISSEVGAI